MFSLSPFGDVCSVCELHAGTRFYEFKSSLWIMRHLVAMENLVFSDSPLVGDCSSGFFFPQSINRKADSKFSLQYIEQE